MDGGCARSFPFKNRSLSLAPRNIKLCQTCTWKHISQFARHRDGLTNKRWLMELYRLVEVWDREKCESVGGLGRHVSEPWHLLYSPRYSIPVHHSTKLNQTKVPVQRRDKERETRLHLSCSMLMIPGVRCDKGEMNRNTTENVRDTSLLFNHTNTHTIWAYES